jgi:hypothetical protein
MLNPHRVLRGPLDKTKIRWTEDTIKYNLGGSRLMDSLPQIRDSINDFDPVYSSFAKDKKFVPPLSVKEALIKKKLANFMQVKRPKQVQLEAKQMIDRLASGLSDGKKENQEELEHLISFGAESGMKAQSTKNISGLPHMNNTLFKRVQSTSALGFLEPDDTRITTLGGDNGESEIQHMNSNELSRSPVHNDSQPWKELANKNI